MATVTAARIEGAFIIDIEPHRDNRGFFARTWDATEFAGYGMDTTVVQCSVSQNRNRATLRGLHMQLPAAPEAKYVRCTAGSIFDVAVDLRPASATYLQWMAVELSGGNRRTFYIPPGCAHGFQTLEDNCEVLYMIAGAYDASRACTVRWDDPQIGIEWPFSEGLTISEKDANALNWNPSILEGR